MKTSESNPRDWLFLAQERLRAADTLFTQEGVTLSGVELLQESVERFLKAYLVAQGWTLRKVHDLAYLLDECILHDPAFSQFQDLAELLTEQFWAQHYPGGDLADVGADYAKMRSDAEQLISRITAAIEKQLPSSSSPPDDRK